MKFTVTLICICLLFSSCFQYKRTDVKTSELALRKKHKIETKIGEKFKIRLLKVNDSLVSGSKNKDTLTFQIADIEAIKQKEFSILKTIGLSAVTAFFLGILILLCCGDKVVNIGVGTPNFN
jgi:hypothetical protein